ncbi:MAG: DUF3768 domain-containing protein [Pseudomonadota bacterium]
MTASRIRELNDRFRKLRQGNGRVFVTAGIEAAGPVFMTETIAAVRAFDDFATRNDPHGEHDFGSLCVREERVFWKIDYYNCDLSGGSEDPSDEAVTCRVLTIMLAHEY